MPKIIDLTGQKFGMLTVIKLIGRKNNHTFFFCRCDCGNETIVTSNNLRTNHTTSCGCLNERLFRAASVKHGLSNHPLFDSWIGMKNRCYFEKHNRYQHYGGKGIIVCDEWKEDFRAFYDWAIANGWQEGLSVDRKKNHLNYCPENCKFSTIPEQNRNRTSNRILIIDGISKIAKEWAEYSGINYGTLLGRLKLGWSHKEAVFGKK